LDQIKALKDTYSDNTCSGFTGGCFFYIRPEIFDGLQPNCILHWTPTELSNITALQVSKIPPSSFSGFTRKVLNGLLNGCAGFSASQLHELEYRISSDSCAGFEANCVALIPSQVFSGFKGDCLANLQFKFLNLVTDEEISYLSPESAPGITAIQISALGLSPKISQCSGFRAQFLSKLENRNTRKFCAGFNANCLGSITAEVSFGFRADCISHFKREAVVSISGV
jgi:hypothetical protein